MCECAGGTSLTELQCIWQAGIKLVLRRALGLIAAPLSLLVLAVSSTAATPTVSFSASAPRQGQPIEVTLSGLAEGEKPSGIKYDGNEYRFFPGADAQTYRALLGIPADLEPGDYTHSKHVALLA